ncbi:MAG: hypothetical protein IJ744_03885 [Lachnospiraceae bacterium]|nr:hypothetical protein [Lachnospiraceae bacterium]
MFSWLKKLLAKPEGKADKTKKKPEGTEVLSAKVVENVADFKDRFNRARYMDDDKGGGGGKF